MIRNRTFWGWGCAIVLGGVLLGCGLGCNPAATTGNVAPTTPRQDKQPEKKEQPRDQPKPDVGRANPVGVPLVIVKNDDRSPQTARLGT